MPPQSRPADRPGGRAPRSGQPQRRRPAEASGPDRGAAPELPETLRRRSSRSAGAAASAGSPTGVSGGAGSGAVSGTPPGGGSRPTRSGRAPRAGTTAHPEARRLTGRTDTSHTGLGPSMYSPRRIGLLAAIAIVLLVTVSFPLRNHYQFRSEQKEVAAEHARLQSEIADLQVERDKLADPAYVEELARNRFGAVKPGENPYRISPVDPVAKAAQEKAAAELAAKPWQQRVWDSVAHPGAPAPKEGHTP